MLNHVALCYSKSTIFRHTCRYPALAFLDLTEVDQTNSIALSAVEQHDIAGVGISIEKPIHKDLFSVDPHQP